MARYIELSKSKKLDELIRQATEKLTNCDLCPRKCGVNRKNGELGFCKVAARPQIASSNLHFGEESPLVGKGGSGTIFFAGCNLNCHFCQNYEISHLTDPSFEVSSEKLAAVMLDLQNRGAHNINFVTPSHVVPQILEALKPAIDRGLSVPLVYNTSAYDSVETLELLDGIIDIYMPDAKIMSSEQADRLCQAPDYPEVARDAISEMHRQVGDLEINDRGIATQGLLVRHLVMPNELAGTKEWMEFLAGLSTETYVNIMGQYHPCGRVAGHRQEFPDLHRPVSSDEMKQAYKYAKEAGINRLDQRIKPGMHELFQILMREK